MAARGAPGGHDHVAPPQAVSHPGRHLRLPHAATHTVLLPFVAAFNLLAAPAADQTLRRALATDDVPKHLARASAELGAPCSLAELGVTERDFDEITAQAQAQPYANPRPVTDEALRTLLADALNGALAP